MTKGKGLVITILTCNLTSTPQGLDIAKDAFITFCFTRVSCDIQIRQLINGIKCASALADCVPLSRSARVINIRILLKATSYFSPSLHYVWIFTSRIFLNKRNWVRTTEFIIVWAWNYDCDNTHRPFCRYLITNIIKELVIKILEMILRFYTYVILSFEIDGTRSPHLQTNYTPVLVTNIPFLVPYAKNEVAAKIVRVYVPMLWVIPGKAPT